MKHLNFAVENGDCGLERGKFTAFQNCGNDCSKAEEKNPICIMDL